MPADHVQALASSGNATGGPPTAHTTTAFPGVVTSGNTIAVMIWLSGTSRTIDRVTDSQGNTYTLVNNPTNSASRRCCMAYAYNVTGGSSFTLTVETSGTTTVYVIAHEITGVLSASSPLDKSTINSQAAPGTGADAITSGNVTTDTDGQYIFSGFSTATATNPAHSAGTNPVTFTLAGNGSNSGVRYTGEYYVQPAAGTIASTATTTVDGPYLTGIMTFKAIPAASQVNAKLVKTYLG